MVDFDAAVAAVQDPNADPVFLAKIAYENPEFGANVVANPRAYPGLKRWVAEFGDERARQQLVAMGWPFRKWRAAAADLPNRRPSQWPNRSSRNSSISRQWRNSSSRSSSISRNSR